MTNQPDRLDYLAGILIDGRHKHRHITPAQHDEFTWLLWEAHDGDDSCACLRHVIWAVQVRDELLALEIMRNCIAEHDAGARMRQFDEQDIVKGLEG